MDTLTFSSRLLLIATITSTILIESQCAVRDLSVTPVDDRSNLYRKARDDRYYYNNRYGSAQGSAIGRDDRDRGRDRDHNIRGPKPETSPEARDDPANTGVEKRCIRCATSYLDPYEYRDYHDRDRSSYYDRYDRTYDRGSYDRGSDRGYDRGYDYDRYDRSYYDRDRWYERRPDYDRYYYYRSQPYDRYDRDYDRYDRTYDRGYGYDNRGYDYRKPYDYRSSAVARPWDNARGSDYYSGRGYYSSRPETNNYWGYDRGYASNYNYGGRGGADSGRDPYYRRDPYESGYRGTSYLYERNPTPVTTTRSPTKDEPGATDRPDVNPNKAADSPSSG